MLPAVLHIWGQASIQGGIQTYSRASKHMGASKYMGGVQTYGGIQTYGWCPNMGGIQTYRMHPHIWGHPNVWGHMDTPLVWHSMLSVFCMYRGHPNITHTYSRVFKHMGVSTHTGASKHMGAPNIQGGLKIWGIQSYRGASKCMGEYGHSLSVTKQAFFVLCMYGASKHYQTYRGCPNIWGHPNIQGDVQTYR